MTSSESPDRAFEVSKQEVWEAWVKVKANKGAPGVDGKSLEQFEADVQGNLYKIWNRMSSGSYFPPPVRAVDIPKPHGGGVRTLGIPTIGDRVAQTVVARRLEAKVEPLFHPNSYGYRPGRGALDAVAVCRARCWKKDWVIDLDIKAFFDTVPWELILKAVTAHLDVNAAGKGPEAWMLLCIRRWLAAPTVDADGVVRARDRGTPQGSAISPILSNLFMHYAFDAWITEVHPGVSFERYADDVVVHCASYEQAQAVLESIRERLGGLGLSLHPDKTQIVYCKDARRRRAFGVVTFTFLGFTFAPRMAINRHGRTFLSFLPAISNAAMKKISTQIRRWKLHLRVQATLPELAKMINPVVAGWMAYYGRFYRSATYRFLTRINAYLLRWLRNKFRRLNGVHRAHRALADLVARYPRGFAHWSAVGASAW